MRTLGWLAVTWCAGMALCAGQASQIPESKVTVCMRGGDDSEVISRARDTASRMFLPVGVRLAWRSDRRFCRESKERAIMVSPSTQTPRSRLPGALACALPFEGVHVEVFLDRMRGAPEPIRALLLAHVLVHEITHLLESTDRHSETGVMKAHWDRGDFARMTRQSLGFTPLDVALIHQGLAAWNAQRTQVPLAAARGSVSEPRP